MEARLDGGKDGCEEGPVTRSTNSSLQKSAHKVRGAERSNPRRSGGPIFRRRIALFLFSVFRPFPRRYRALFRRRNVDGFTGSLNVVQKQFTFQSRVLDPHKKGGAVNCRGNGKGVEVIPLRVALDMKGKYPRTADRQAVSCTPSTDTSSSSLIATKIR
jgi:hypothetical protein